MKQLLLKETVVAFAAAAFLVACDNNEASSQDGVIDAAAPDVLDSVEHETAAASNQDVDREILSASASSEGGQASCNQELATRTFQQCKVCHSTEKDAPHKTGPNLFGLHGRVVGSVEGFRFSPTLRNAGFVWDDETMDEFLTNPQKYLPRNRMAFGGVTDPGARAALICMLKDLK